ncbi:MAG TPA: tail fiber domain-containing protein [Thermoanaerobaculia bacterium]|nr:tail fiber domain-containing protein [Thermoanaerobaculia bacterium]
MATILRRALFGLAVLCCFVVAAPSFAQLETFDGVPGEGPFVPPACTGSYFSDVTCASPFDPWIEQYVRDGITSGCGGGMYCPDAAVTRSQMAVFVEKAMRGTANWWPGDRGNENTGVGFEALFSNATDNASNTAVGYKALWTQSYDPGGLTGFANTAVGHMAMYSNQPTAPDNGRYNTAVGDSALWHNTTGEFNTALGAGSLWDNRTASENTAVGYSSLNVSRASRNTAVGHSSLGLLTSGTSNTAVGWRAGNRVGDQIVGYTGSSVMLVNINTGSYNTFVGIAGATADVSNCTAVGMDAYCSATDQVRLGNFYVTSIGGKVGWSTLSDARAKTDVSDLEMGLDLVLALRPVSFRYVSGNGRLDFGFLAQDVEAVLGDAYNVVDVGGDADRTLSLRYADLIAPLVKAVQEQQAQIEARDARVRSLETQLDAQRADLDELRDLVRSLLSGRARSGGD